MVPWFFGGIQLRGTVPGLDSMESWFASLFPPPDVTRRTAHLRSLFLLPLFNGVDGSNVTTRAKASATKGGRSPKKLFSEQTGCSYPSTFGVKTRLAGMSAKASFVNAQLSFSFLFLNKIKTIHRNKICCQCVRVFTSGTTAAQVPPVSSATQPV